MVVSSLSCCRHLWLNHSNTRRFKLGEIKAKLVLNASKSGCGESVSTDVIRIGRRKVCDAGLRCWFWARGFAVDRKSQRSVCSRLRNSRYTALWSNYTPKTQTKTLKEVTHNWTLSVWPMCHQEECPITSLSVNAALVMIYSCIKSNTFTYLF